MANPSHSIPVPDPGNPEQTSNSVRPEPVEGPDGRSGFDKLSPNGILDRRTLLTGSAALTGAAAVAAAGAAGAGLATAGMPGLDPVVAVYRRLLELQADPLNDYCDEDDPAYMRLCYAIDDADDALVLTRATSTDGIRVKFARLAYLHHGGPERAIRDCELAHSIIADFAHLLARRAL